MIYIYIFFYIFQGTPNDLIKYEIVATQATGGYHIDGQYNTSAKVTTLIINYLITCKYNVYTELIICHL